MIIKFFGCKIYISPLFIALITLILFFDASGLALLGLSSIVLHELGHLLFMASFKVLPQEIIMQPAGIMIKRNGRISSYLADLFVALGGCAFNLLFAIIGYLFFLRFPHEQLWLIFTASNVIIGVFNILPIYGLDGYDVLKIIILKLSDEHKAILICKIVSIIILIALISFVFFAMHQTNFNLNLSICITYLLILLLINIRC